jgi:hypothetical protein
MNTQTQLFNYDLNNEQVNNLNGIDKLIYIHISNMIKNQNYTFNEAMKHTVNYYADKQSRFRIKKNIMKVFKSENKTIKNFTYLMFDGSLYKIGKSKNPLTRLKALKIGNPSIELIAYTDKIEEKYLHNRFFESRVDGEWFDLSEEKLKSVINYFEHGKILIGKDGLNYCDSVQKMKEGLKSEMEQVKKYIIDFGKYNGTPIIDMVTDEQIDYCKWLYKNMVNDLSKRERRNSIKYKAFYYASRKML